MSRFRFRGRTPLPSGDAQFTVAWDAPETDADGEPVATITSHSVYYSQNILDRELSAASASVAMPTLTYTATGLIAGTWYAWIAAVSTDGESEISPPFEVTAT